MNALTFYDLENKLSNLEDKWRQERLPTSLPAFVRGTHNLQYFALDSATAKSREELPVVVLVGINYTQAPEKIPDQLPLVTSTPAVVDYLRSDPRYKLRAAYDHWVKNGAAWEDCALAPVKSPALAFPDSYHLVLTNLSPWITTKKWESEMCANAPARGGRLLASPPYKPAHPGWPYDHLEALRDKLKLEDAWWIGHGKDAVWPRWHLVNSKLGVPNWILVGNLFTGPFKPNLRTDGTVKFGGEGPRK